MNVFISKGTNPAEHYIKNGSLSQKTNSSTEENALIHLDTISHVMFLIVYAIIILLGILFNLIAILTYTFYHKKPVYQSTSNNFNNKILSMRPNLNDDALLRAKLTNQNGNQVRYTYGRMSSSESNNIRNLTSINDSNQTSASLSTNESNKYLFKFKSKSIPNPSTTLNVNPSHHQLHNSMITLGIYNSGYNRIKRCSYFILMLSCCDLFICSINMPIDFLIQSSYVDLTLKYIFWNNANADFLCKAVYFFGKLPIILEIELLLMIAIDRYASVFHPMNINVPDNKRLILFLQVTFSCIISFPSFRFYKSNLNKSDRNITMPSKNNWEFPYLDYEKSAYSLLVYCTVEEKLKSVYDYYQITLFCLFMASLIIITVCYLRVYKHVYKASQNQRRESTSALNHLSVQNFTSSINKSKNESLNDGIESNFSSNDSGLHFSSSKKVFKKDGKDENNSTNKSKSKKKSSTNEFNSHLHSKMITKLNRKIYIPKIQLKNDSKPNLRENSSRHLLHKKELSKIEESTIMTKNTEDLDEKRCSNIDEIKKEKSSDNLKKLDLNYGTKSSLLRRTSFPILNDQVVSDDSKLNSSTDLEKTSTLRTSDFKSTKSAVGRIRRYSDNQNSTSTQNAKNSYNLGEFSSSLLELSKPGSSFLSSNRVSIRKHSSKPLKHRKTAKLLGIATFAFAVTWIPYWVYLYLLKIKFSFHNRFFSESENYLIFKFLQNSFYLNFVLNPVFYSFVDKRFRQNMFVMFKKVFDLICCDGKNCFNLNNKDSSQRMGNNSSEVYSNNLKRNLSNASNKYYNNNLKNDKLNAINVKSIPDSQKDTEKNSYFFGLLPKNIVFLSENCSKKQNNSINLNSSILKTPQNLNETVF